MEREVDALVANGSARDGYFFHGTQQGGSWRGLMGWNVRRDVFFLFFLAGIYQSFPCQIKKNPPFRFLE